MITSTANPQVKNLQRLMKDSKERDRQDVFVAEGMKMFLETPQRCLQKVYLSESLFKEKGQAFFEGLEQEVLDDRIFRAVSGTKTPQGILCVVRQSHYRLEDMVQDSAPFLMLLESLQDPGNLGMILRTAEGAGASGVILSQDSVDIYNPKTVRATMGSIYRMPFLYVERIEDILPRLKEKGVHTYAAHLRGKNVYSEEDYRTGCAFLVGNEGSGLSRELSCKTDIWIRIPMHGKLESLNAAAAASILMYEACRQRGR